MFLLNNFPHLDFDGPFSAIFDAADSFHTSFTSFLLEKFPHIAPDFLRGLGDQVPKWGQTAIIKLISEAFSRSIGVDSLETAIVEEVIYDYTDFFPLLLQCLSSNIEYDPLDDYLFGIAE